MATSLPTVKPRRNYHNNEQLLFDTKGYLLTAVETFLFTSFFGGEGGLA